MWDEYLVYQNNEMFITQFNLLTMYSIRYKTTHWFSDGEEAAQYIKKLPLQNAKYKNVYVESFESTLKH